MTSLFRAASIVAAGAVLAACDLPFGGDARPDRLSANRTVRGTADPLDADFYRLAVPAEPFRILLRASSGNAADTVVAEVVDERSQVLAEALSVGSDTTIAGQSSRWLALQPATYYVRVRAPGADDGGPYELRVYTRDPRPETENPALTLGRTVTGERLEADGDVDEFTLHGAAGDEWIVIARSLHPESGGVAVQLVAPGTGEVLDAAVSSMPSSGPGATASDRIMLPRTGTYTVRAMSGGWDEEGFGPYHLRVDRVNRAPESAPAALPLGAVVDEAIGTVGDVDEFTVTAPTGTEVNLMMQLLDPMPRELVVELLRDGTRVTPPWRLTDPTASLDDFVSGVMVLEGGTYTIRVSSATFGPLAGAAGRYRLELYPVDRRPEVPGALVIDGPTLAGALERAGDVDEFSITGTPGALVVVHASGGGPEIAETLRLEVDSADGVPTSWAELDGAEPKHIRRRVPASGSLTVRVARAYRQSARGPYTVGAYTVSEAPEHVPATLTVGEPMTEERIDRPGDMDVFTFRGTPGTQVSVFLGRPGDGVLYASVRRASFDPGNLFAFGGPMSMDGHSTGRITLEDEPYMVIVAPMPGLGGSGTPHVGEYALRVFPIDRRPEGRAAAYVLGDTIRGEPLYPAVDIDEYTFTVTETVTVDVFWEGAAAAFLDRGGEDVNVWYSGTWVDGELLRHVTLAPGTYRLRVLRESMDAPGPILFIPDTSTPYRFAITPR